MNQFDKDEKQKPSGNVVTGVLKGLGVMAGSATALVAVLGVASVYMPAFFGVSGWLAFAGAMGSGLTLFAAAAALPAAGVYGGFQIIKEAISGYKSKRNEQREQTERLARSRMERAPKPLPASPGNEFFAAAKRDVAAGNAARSFRVPLNVPITL